MRNPVVILTGMVGLAAGHACGQVELQRLSNGIEVAPQRVARAVREPGGVRLVGDWRPYGGSSEGHTREYLELVYDCYEPTGVCDDRPWFLGTSYCNMFVTNDMTLENVWDPDLGLRRVDFAWQWTCAGFGTEPCMVGVFTQGSVPCEPDSFDYSGWIFDFGILSCNTGAYYFANVTLSTGNWPIPNNQTGSHWLYFFQGQTTSGMTIPATCAQPMLWGTGDARGDPDAWGTQGPEQFDDVLEADGSHVASECYTYEFGLCPDPLGAMVAFWGVGDRGDCFNSDVNRDGEVNTRDVVAFLNLWANGNNATDCDGNGVVDTGDIVCFLNLWRLCWG